MKTKVLLYLLLFLGLPALSMAQASDLIISEYVEGSSYNKALEIYNGTGASVNLAAYQLQKDANGNNSFSTTLSLSGTLANGETYVVVHSNASSSLTSKADYTIYGNVVNFNGNDQVRLVKSGTEIDRIGVSGGSNFAKDITYVRKSTVNAPQSGQQDPGSNGEWTAYAQNTFTYIGSHTMDGGTSGGGGSTGGGSTTASELIISEYVEGSSYNKALEIYNGTGSSVSLSSYQLQKDVNGDNSFGSSLSLSGTLADGQTYVVAHSNASSTLTSKADYTTSGGAMNFNGNDQVRLVKNSTEIDRIGITGGSNFAQDITYIRNASVTAPQSGPQDPRSNGEWTAASQDDFSNIGSHTMDGSTSGGGDTGGGDTGGGGTGGGSDPGTYYDGTAGLSGATLKQKLHEIIRNHTRFPYTSSSTDVWDILKDTDEDPSNSNNLILIYTGRSEDKDRQDTGSGDNDAWNREHVWAKSHGFPNSGDTAYTDVHHLRPCDRSVNSSRSNKDFDNGGSFHSEATGCRTDSDSWEPRDEVKGDVARMMFYMVVRYEYGAYDLELVDYTGTSNSPIFGKLSTLLQWHAQDPVDDWERSRNEKIFTSYQGNRNPFIDHPEFVSAIWGAARLAGETAKPQALKLEVFPNPTFNEVKVNLPENVETNTMIRVINMNGQVVKHTKIREQKQVNIDLQNIPAGVYFVQVPTKNGFLFERIQKK